MHIALGYSWSLTAAGYHFERALRALGHTVTYVGPATYERPGYDHAALDKTLTHLLERPDLYLWIDSAGRYFPAGIEDVSVPTACYLIDVHLGHWRQNVASFFDAVFIAQRDYLQSFQAAVGHEQVYWLPLAAASDVHRQIDRPRTLDVGFVGNLALAHHKTARARRLQLIAQHFKTNDFYRQYTPAEVGEVYSQAKIVFNTSIAGDVTMRIFEGSACGALVLTDSTANGLNDLFKPGSEILTYTDDRELLNQISYYLTHETERAGIAAAGQQRTLSQHLYIHRVQAILDIVAAASFKQVAPMRKASSKQRFQARRDIYTHLHMLDVLLDESRAAGYNLIQRGWMTLPCLARRMLF